MGFGHCSSRNAGICPTESDHQCTSQVRERTVSVNIFTGNFQSIWGTCIYGGLWVGKRILKFPIPKAIVMMCFRH